MRALKHTMSLAVVALLGGTWPAVSLAQQGLPGGASHPPANRPLHLGNPPGLVQSEASLRGETPAREPELSVFRGATPFRGTMSGSGRIVVTPGAIRIQDGPNAIEVRFRLPDSLPPLRPDSGNGTYSITERSDPGAGARRLVAIALERGLVLGAVWMVGPEPLQLDLGDSLQLVQQRPAAPARGGHDLAPVSVTRAGRPIARLDPGRVLPVAGPRRNFSALVELSSRSSAAEGGNRPSEYFVLKAWLVPAMR